MNVTAKGRGARFSHPDRAQLVAAARVAFDDLGPHAGLDEIAGNAGISTATLTDEFGDKDGLVTAVLEELIGSLRDADDLERLLAQPSCPAQAGADRAAPVGPSAGRDGGASAIDGVAARDGSRGAAPYGSDDDSADNQPAMAHRVTQRRLGWFALPGQPL